MQIINTEWWARFLSELSRGSLRLWRIANPNERAFVVFVVSVVAVVLVAQALGPRIGLYVGHRTRRLTVLALCIAAVLGVMVGGEYLAMRNGDLGSAVFRVFDMVRRI